MIGFRIAALRRSIGMSQSELAQRLKISPSAVGMYEQGRREPSLETVAEMAEVLGVSIDFLVTGKAVNEYEEELVNRLLTDRVTAVDQHLAGRPGRPFSRQELALLFAAMLMEP